MDATAGAEATRKWVWLLVVGMLVLFLAVPSIGYFKAKGRQEALDRRGVRAEGVVVATDQDGDKDYLIVAVEPCDCRLVVTTTNLARHPVGTSLPIRYDPEDLDAAEALVDRPNPYETFIVVLASVVVSIAISVPLVVVALRRQRRSRALFDTAAPSGIVRVEVWRRSMFGNNEIVYLSAYPVDVPPGGPPLLCLPVTEAVAAQIEHSDLPPHFEVFGRLVPGEPLALRRGDLDVVPGGQTQDAAWEARHRRGQVSARPGAPEGPVLRDAGEARSVARFQRLLLFVWLAFMPASLIRVVPERFLSGGLVMVFALVALAVVAMWHHQRLMTRLGRRLVGPSQGRRERRAARSAVGRWLASPAGKEEMASLLGITVEEREASERRTVHWVYATVGLTVVAMVVFVAQLALS